MPGGSYLRFQHAGEKALHEKRYKSAIAAFDHAFTQASTNPKNDCDVLNTILDLRVETHIMLKDPNAALKDAQTMVRNDRGDPRGYLRCGQLRRREIDYEGAQKWYDQGLKHVSKTNQYYASLESMRLKTAGKLSGAEALTSRFRDPFAVLPMDIIHMLWQYLDFQQAVTSLRVSKGWRDTLLAIPSVWKVLDLVGVQKRISLMHVKACIPRLQTPPTKIRLVKLAGPAVAYLQPYFERWTNIEHLHLNTELGLASRHAWTLPSGIRSLRLGQQCSVTPECVDGILRHFDMLQQARFDAITEHSTRGITYSVHKEPAEILPELRHLVLRASKCIMRALDLTPRGVFRNYPNLDVFECSGIEFGSSRADLSTATSLRHLRLQSSDMAPNFKLPSSLEALSWDSSVSLSLFSHFSPLPPEISTDPQDTTETSPNLKVLELNAVAHASRLITMVKRSDCATLTRLGLIDCHIELSEFMSLLDTGLLSKLTFLAISLPDLDDDQMARIATRCPMLEDVELKGLRITGVTVKELCSHTAIKKLNLLSCLAVSPDAIDWARGRGVKVTVNQMGKQASSSGQRVRYG